MLIKGEIRGIIKGGGGRARERDHTAEKWPPARCHIAGDGG